MQNNENINDNVQKELDWEKIKLITQSENHFNNLCFNIRALASTWLLASLGGVGFLLTKTVTADLQANHLLVLLCWVSSIGIFVLWILDLLVYQKMLNAWFASREPIETKNINFPQMFKEITKSQPGGRAANLIKIYYLALVSLPLALALYVSFYLQLILQWTVLTGVLTLFLIVSIYLFSPSKK